MAAAVAPGMRVAAAAGVVGALVGPGFVALGTALGRAVGMTAGEHAPRASVSRINTKKMRFIDIAYIIQQIDSLRACQIALTRL